MGFRKLAPFFLVVLGIAVLIFVATERMKSEKTPVVEEASTELQPVTAIRLQELIRGNDAKVTIVNFWATFCGPCREEFPFFLSAYREYKDEGLELLFVSMDFDTDRPQIEEFLNEQGVNFVTYLREGKDDEFIRSVHPDWSGVLPTTLIYDQQKNLVHFLPKALTYEELEDLVVGVLNSKKQPSSTNNTQKEEKK